MSQGFSAAKAALFNKLIQDGLSQDAALAQAGISNADLGNYELNSQGQLGPLIIGFERQPGVVNVTNNPQAQAFVNSFNDAGPVNFNDAGLPSPGGTGTVSVSSIKTTTSTTTTTSGGGSTFRIAGDGTPTPESQAFQTQANATYDQIKSITRQLGPAQFGGNENLTQNERNELVAQRQALYAQYNQQADAAVNSLAPSAPVGSVTVPNTTTSSTTTVFSNAWANTPVSGAQDTQLQQQEIVSTLPPPAVSSIQTSGQQLNSQLVNEYGDSYTPLGPVPLSSIQTSNSATAGLTPAQLEALGGADPTDPFIRARLDLPPLGPSQPTLISSIRDLFNSTPSTAVPANQVKTNSTLPAGQELNEYGDAYTPLPPVPLNEIRTAASTDTDEELVQLGGPSDNDILTQASTDTDEELVQLGGPSDNDILTQASTDTDEELVQLGGPSDNDILTQAQATDESTYQQLVQAFSQADIQTGPAPFAQVAALDGIPLVAVSAIADTPTDVPVEQQGDVLVDLNTGQEYPVDPDSPFVQTPGGLLVSPDEIPVDQQDGTLVDLNTGEVLGIDENGFTNVGGLNVLPEDIPNQEAIDQELVPFGIEEPSGTALISEPEGAEADPFAQPPVGENDLVFLNTGENLGVADEAGFVQSSTGLNVLPEDQEAGVPDGYLVEFGADGDRVLNPEQVTEAQEQAGAEFSARQRARQQQSIASQRKQSNNGDWRVRIRLAPQSKYLYNAPQPGILQPLTVTDGVIFPYTPTISTSYRANYSPYDLTHSNYKGYFYGNSTVEPVTITGTFTAQDTSEANYLLAVIHFFRSATKMFYGQDAERGAPPPLVYLTGLGEYQFNEHSCLIQNFSYSLPNDVDYIRAGSPGNIGTNLTTNRDRQSVATNGVFGSLNRLAAAFLTKGAVSSPPAPPTLGLNRPTYVPTKMEITVTLLPIQSRQQVSKQFSVKEFANGNLLRGGFW